MSWCVMLVWVFIVRLWVVVKGVVSYCLVAMFA